MFRPLWYNLLSRLGVGSKPPVLLQRSVDMTENDFSFNAVDAKIHGLSVQVGELFADLYAKSGTDSTRSAECLEAYRSLRRLLPKQSDGVRHVGARAAYKATQGMV